MVGLQNSILVVLNNDDSVAYVAQVGQGGQQTLIVSLMQPYGGLVEDIHHPDKSCADLAREPNPLSLAA